MSEVERVPAAPGSREEWRPVVGYERFYEVSNHGRVRSMLNNWRRVLNGALDSYGYPTVKLSKMSKQTRHKVHRLVCTAFNGLPPTDGLDCAHLDGDRTNARPENLAWATRAENMSHKRIHGTQQSGERGPGAKLTQAQVDEIRARAASGESRPALAKEFGVARGHLRRIVIGETWK